jgi:hypothetical protein
MEPRRHLPCLPGEKCLEIVTKVFCREISREREGAHFAAVSFYCGFSPAPLALFPKSASEVVRFSVKPQVRKQT